MTHPLAMRRQSRTDLATVLKNQKASSHSVRALIQARVIQTNFPTHRWTDFTRNAHLAADLDASLVHLVLGVPKRKWESHPHHHRKPLLSGDVF